MKTCTRRMLWWLGWSGVVGIMVLHAGCQCSLVVPPAQFAACRFVLKKAHVDFGAIPAGGQHQLPLTLYNPSNRTCSLEVLRFSGTQPPEHSAFGLGEPVVMPLQVPAQTSVTLTLQFSPRRHEQRYQGHLQLQTSQETPIWKQRVALEGHTRDACVAVSQFRIIPQAPSQACLVRRFSARLRHAGLPHCPERIVITQARWSAGTSREFSFTRLFSTPFELERGKSQTLEWQYRPIDAGPDQGTIELFTERRGDEAYRIPFEASPIVMPQRNNAFVQSKSNDVDILFVVDNSCSMVDEQASLAANFSSFIAWAARSQANYQIGVITTDDACLQGPPRLLTPQTPNLEQTFQKNVRVGTTGSSREQGLASAALALSRTSSSQCNADLLRPHANLSLIFISDEPDQSPLPVESYIQEFLRRKKGRRVRASVVTGLSPAGCNSEAGSAQPAPRYEAIAKQLQGVALSICDENWSGKLNQLGFVSFGQRRHFLLSHRPVPSTLTVRVNGQLARADAEQGWTYVSKDNTVVFAPQAVPPAPSRIEISYQESCYTP